MKISDLEKILDALDSELKISVIDKNSKEPII